MIISWKLYKRVPPSLHRPQFSLLEWAYANESIITPTQRDSEASASLGHPYRTAVIKCREAPLLQGIYNFSLDRIFTSYVLNNHLLSNNRIQVPILTSVKANTIIWFITTSTVLSTEHGFLIQSLFSLYLDYPPLCMSSWILWTAYQSSLRSILGVSLWMYQIHRLILRKLKILGYQVFQSENTDLN